MKLAEIWRYPVKSMAGEKLETATVSPLGIDGDRIVHVENARGRFITSRSHPRLLGHQGTIDANGQPLIDGLPWTDPELRRHIINIAGPGAQLVSDTSAGRFDVLPLLVATDGAIKEFGHDHRRLRPNLVISGVEGLQERTWEGKRLRIGNIVIGIDTLRGRCVMTTYDPDTLKQNPAILKEIVRKFGGTLALNCYVILGGKINVGDNVKLVEAESA
jgi:uncharacterized protein